jgi:hypothetical protein
VLESAGRGSGGVRRDHGQTACGGEEIWASSRLNVPALKLQCVSARYTMIMGKNVRTGEA